MILIQPSGDNYIGLDQSTGRTYSLAELESMANRRDAEAQCAMGDYFNAKSEFHHCTSWYEKAAEQGHARAQWNLGNFYLAGLGGYQKDVAKAEVLFKGSADQGWSPGMLGLGQLYMLQDKYVDAIYWLEKADATGHPQAKEWLDKAETLRKMYGG